MDKKFSVVFKTGINLVVNEDAVKLISENKPFPENSNLKYINLEEILFIIEVDPNALAKTTASKIFSQ